MRDTTKIVDMTLPIDDRLPMWPGLERVKRPKIKLVYTMEKDEFRSSKILGMSTHAGTHIDAPAHMIKEGKKLLEVPLDRLVGDCVILHIPKGELERITPEDLEKAKPEVREGDIVLIHTHWDSKYYIESEEYLTNKRPGLSPEAARWLVKKKIKALGTDTMAPQPGGFLEIPSVIPPTESVHHILLGNGIILIEQLTNLCELAGKRAKIVVLPLALAVPDGSPVRAIAIVDE